MSTESRTPAAAAVWKVETLQLPIWYRASPHKARRDPWLTVVFDEAARLARAVSVTPSYPTVDEVLGCLKEIMVTDSAKGGTGPAMLRTDLSPLFTSPEFQAAVAEMGVEHQHGARGLSPDFGGKIEHWFQDLCDDCLSELVGYRHPGGASFPVPESLPMVPFLRRALRYPEELERRIRRWDTWCCLSP